MLEGLKKVEEECQDGVLQSKLLHPFQNIGCFIFRNRFSNLYQLART
jgi:hypothetical protein